MPALGLRGRLSLMMATVYAIQGSFWPLLAVHLGDLGIEGRARGWIFATLAIASFTTPVVVGQLADKRFAADRMLALIYAIGSLILMVLGSGLVRNAPALFCVFLIYWMLTAPTFALASTITLRNLKGHESEFGRIRLWGTFGWMVVGSLVAIVMKSHGGAGRGQGAHEAFLVAAALSAGLSVFCLRLPRTPPLARHASGPARSGNAFEGLRRPTMGVLLAIAFCVALTTPFVYQVVPTYLQELGLERAWVAPAMSLSQILEIGALVWLTRFLGHFGFRRVMAFGLFAWVAYHGLMACHPSLPLVIAGLPIQGLAIACFHIASVMYIDTQAPLDARAGAQGLYAMVTSGLGSLLGNVMAGEVVGRAGSDMSLAFIVPTAINALMFVALLVAFRPRLAVPVVPVTVPTIEEHAQGAAPARVRVKKRRTLVASK